ncbi:hypothetical protein LCGC14_2045130, partial [marine sediment metagenome]
IITPALIKHITLSYSIGLIDNPGRRVTEQIKIGKENINFIENYLVISFKINELHDPNICEITLKNLNIYLKDSPRLTVKINKTHSFKSIQSGTSPISEKTKSAKLSKVSQKKLQKIKAQKELPTRSDIKKTKDSSADFTEAYEKFKERIQETDLMELLRKKTGSVEFNLKNFGISLLCKTLLLVKQVNELVDNEFQNDLQEFLKRNIFESIKEEVSV